MIPFLTRSFSQPTRSAALAPAHQANWPLVLAPGHASELLAGDFHVRGHQKNIFVKRVREGETRGHREKPIPFPSSGISPFRNIIRGQLGKKHSCGEEDGYEEEGEEEGKGLGRGSGKQEGEGRRQAEDAW